MNFQSPTADEINIVKKMSPEEIDDLKRRILQCDPTVIFQKAKDSHKPDKQYIFCPNCGNGFGKNHTPVDVTFKNDRWLYHCFANSDLEGDLLSIIATEHNLNLRDRNDFCTALAIGANLIGYNLFCAQPISNPFPTLPRIFEGVESKNGFTPIPQSFNTHSTPLPRTFEGKLYYGAADVAKIIGVDKTTVLWWNRKGLFNADIRAHDNTYLYEIERVMQLKDVYHANWLRGGYEPSPTCTAQPSCNPAPVATEFTRLEEAQNNLPKFFAAHKTFRGLTQETLQRLGWGFLHNYKHPKNDFVFPAIIIPNCKGGILARQIDGKAKSNITPSAVTVINLPKDNQQLLVVEGAIDAASIAQATNWQFGIISIGGTSGKESLYRWLQENYHEGSTRPPIILLLDHDSDDPQKDSGQKAAKEISSELVKLGFSGVNRIISNTPKYDANDILLKEGDAVLRDIIKKLLSSIKTDSDGILNAKIIDWQQKNGKIDPDILKELIDAANIFNNATITASFANDFFVQKCLGAFRFYNFFADIEQNFFLNLENARNTIKEKKLSFKKDNNKPQPTDDDLALLNISLNTLKQHVEKHFNNAQKLHTRYQEQLQCDALNQKFQAEIESRKDDTTQGKVPDCPIDLKIPLDCYFSDRGISIIDHSGKFPKTIIATKNPIVPTKIFREPSKHLTQYEVAVKTDTTWRLILVDGQSLFDPRKVLILASVGALIEEPKQLAKFFARIIAENSLPEIKSYEQTGWKNNDFDTFAYPTGGDDYVVRRLGFDYEKYFAARGDRDLLLNTFFDACDKGGSICRVFAGTALAAPLVQPLSISNLQILLNGKSGSGKTAFAKITAALFGNPRKLIGTFAATQKNRLAQAAAFNDLPSFFDELETLQGKNAEDSLQEMIYNYAEGKGNQAQKRDGTARETFEFFGSRVMTAERNILKSHDKRGAYKRLIQIHSDKLFDDLFATKLHLISETNYGYFGSLWTSFISPHIQEIMKMWFDILQHFSVYPPQPTEPTQLKHVAAAFLAFQFFAVASGRQKNFNHGAFLSDVENILALLPSPTELDDSTRAIEDLRSFVAGHEKFFAHDIKDNSPDGFTFISSQAWECYGKIFKNGEVAFLPTALRKILENELGFASCDELVKEFAQKGFLRCSKNSRNRYRISTRLNGKIPLMYRFNAGILLSEDNYNLSDDTAQSI